MDAEEVPEDDELVETTLVDAAILRMLQDSPVEYPNTPPGLSVTIPTYAEVARVGGIDHWDEEGGDEGSGDGSEAEMDHRDSFVPCEICNEMVEFHAYADHLEACSLRESVLSSTLPMLRPMNRNIQESLFMLPRGDSPRMPRLPEFMVNRPVHFIYDSQNDVVAQIGIRLMQALQTNNEYEYNNAMQELMGGPVRVGVSDIDAVCPVINDADVPVNTACTICLAKLPICDVGAAAAADVGSDNDDDSDNDSVCAPLPAETRKTPCGHYFCDPCITKWLGDHKTCPNCLQACE